MKYHFNERPIYVEDILVNISDSDQDIVIDDEKNFNNVSGEFLANGKLGDVAVAANAGIMKLRVTNMKIHEGNLIIYTGAAQ